MKQADKYRWDYIAVAVLLAAMAIIAFINILGRYLFHYSLAFTEEVAINLFVWMTVAGSGIVFERCGHLGMTSLYNKFPALLKKATLVSSALLGAFLFIAVDLLLVNTIYREITIFHAKSPALGLPVWIYYSGVILLSPFVFRGIYRGAAAQIADLTDREER